MALLYEDKTLGPRIRYRLLCIDGTFINKSKTFKSQASAEKAMQKIEQLETLSAEGKLTAREIAYFIYKKLISVSDSRYLTSEQVYLVSPFDMAPNDSRRFG